MRTTRKQFPVNVLTSGRLAFTIQRAKARGRQQIKKNGGTSGGTMCRLGDSLSVLLWLLKSDNRVIIWKPVLLQSCNCFYIIARPFH